MDINPENVVLVGGFLSSIGKFVSGIAGDIVGAGLSFLGGERRNEAQVSSAREAAAVNAEQAELDRQFQAKESRLARSWGTGEAKRAQSWEVGQINKNLRFQQRMSDTAHQREAKDLERAGLNRILSVSKGGPGASSPGGTGVSAPGAPSGAHGSGSRAAMTQAEIENTTARAASTALGLRAARREDKVAEADVRLRHSQAKTDRENREVLKQQAINAMRQEDEIEARTAELYMSTALKRAEALKELSAGRYYEAEAAHTAKDIERLEQELRLRKYAEPSLSTEAEIDRTAYGRGLRYLGRLNPFSSTAKDVLSIPFRSGVR